MLARLRAQGEMKEEKDATRGQNQEDGAAADASPARMIGAMSRSFVHRSNSNSLLVKWHRRIVVLMETEQEVSNSVCLFSLDHPVRRVLVAVVSSSAFEQVSSNLVPVPPCPRLQSAFLRCAFCAGTCARGALVGPTAASCGSRTSWNGFPPTW